MDHPLLQIRPHLKFQTLIFHSTTGSQIVHSVQKNNQNPKLLLLQWAYQDTVIDLETIATDG